MKVLRTKGTTKARWIGTIFLLETKELRIIGYLRGVSAHHAQLARNPEMSQNSSAQIPETPLIK